ncbi:MAG: ABC transporter permease, partial [Rhodoferax sp.]
MTSTTALPATAALPTAGTLPANLASQLKRAERRKRLFSISLTLPLLVFLVVIFIVPIGALLIRAVENPEVANTLGRTGAALAQWDRKSVPPDTAYASLAHDLAGIQEQS